MGKSILYVVSTPIGNLNDISLRAIETLKSVDLILAEDTRTFSVLAKHFSIETKVISYHEHNEAKRAKEVTELISSGKNVALISDAGTPTINDPGYRIVNACLEAAIEVSPIPGASALVAALSASGFETHKFLFSGFLPVKSGKREKALKSALEFESTSVFYESPHRILKSLECLNSLEPAREICLAREITKKFEEFNRGPVQDILEDYKSRPSIKGEFVLLVRGKDYSAEA